MKFIRNNETAGNQIVEYIKKIAEDGYCEITKDDTISIEAKAVKRTAFTVQYSGIIFQAKTISLVSNDNGETYYYMFLDKNGLDLNRMRINHENEMSIEMMSI